MIETLFRFVKDGMQLFRGRMKTTFLDRSQIGDDSILNALFKILWVNSIDAYHHYRCSWTSIVS